MIVAFAAVYVLWGSTYLGIRFALETLPPFLMAGARFLIAGVILYGWARAQGIPRPKPVHWRSAAIVGGLLLAVGNGGVVFAEQRVPSSLVALLIAGTPLWMTMLDWLVGGAVRPSLQVAIGLVAGLFGVVILIGPGTLAGAGGVDPVGGAVVLLASFSWASGSLYSRRAPLPDSPILATGMEMLSGGVLLFAAGVLFGELGQLDPSRISLRSMLAVAYLIVAGSLVGFTAYIWLLRNTTPARATTYAYVNPVVAVILGWAFADEPVTVRMAIAGAVIVGALVLITRARARERS